MKHLKAILMILAMVVSLSAWADDPKEHVVERGETLASIAAKYGVSTDALIEANPSAANLVYAGMVLTIPEAKTPNKATKSYDTRSISDKQPSDNNNPIVSAKPTQSTIEDDSDNKPGWTPAGRVHYGFLHKPKGYNHHPWSYGIEIGAVYFFKSKLNGPFASVMIGYDNPYYYRYSGLNHEQTNAYLLTLPISAGYRVNLVKKFGIAPFIGIAPKYGIAGKSKVKLNGKEYKEDLKHKFAADFNYGVALSLGAFDLMVYGSTPLNKGQKYYYGKETYLTLAIGFGI